MKTKSSVTKSFLVLLSVILVSKVMLGQDDEHTKKYEKQYTVDKNTVLKLNNKYGNIDIRDWDKNEASIEVTIILKKDVSSQRAEQIFKNVDIEFSQEGNVISAETNYDEEFFRLVNKDQFLQEKRFEVNYLVMLPEYLKVEADNKYGSIFVNKLSSPSAIRIKYGTLKINQIAAKNKDNMALVELGYSKGTIENCEWLKILTKYSQLSIQKSKALIIISKYSKLNIEEGSSVICESKYDSYDIGKLSNFVTESQYSNYRFDVITHKISIETKYTDIKVQKVPAGFESIDIENSYGSIKIAIDPAASYNLKGYAKYAKINYPDDNSRVNRFQENNELKVEGTVGNQKAKAGSVTIDTKYGSINLY